MALSDVVGGISGIIREPRAESREPRAESREPRAESREPRAEALRPARWLLAAAMAGLAVLAFGAQVGESAHSVPFFPSASYGVPQGLARVINHSPQAGLVYVDAYDDAGGHYGPLALFVPGGESVHFSSHDLEQGNAAMGLEAGTGNGQGDWRLTFTSSLDIEVLSYVRTSDGFLTTMHDVVGAANGSHWVASFAPGSNQGQIGLLRLVNLGDESAEVEVTGIDTTGESPGGMVTMSIPAGASQTFTASELETGSAAGLRGGLGDGEGMWQLFVRSDEPIVVMSLLSNAAGHLTNQSTVPDHQDRGPHLVPFFPSATDAYSRQGVVRVINLADEAGEVTIQPYDETTRSFDSMTLSIGANETVSFGSADLESGSMEKGLSTGTGPGEGDWRLELSSDLEIRVLSYVQAEDGLLAAMHDKVAYNGERHRVATFNSGTTGGQLSLLRLINMGVEDAEAGIVGVDDRGESPGSAVRVSIPAGASRTLSAIALEKGDDSIEEALGDGEGMWQLFVRSEQPLIVLSLSSSLAGHLTNLSTTPRESSLGTDGRSTLAQGRYTLDAKLRSVLANTLIGNVVDTEANGLFTPRGTQTSQDAAEPPSNAARSSVRAPPTGTQRAALEALYDATDGPNWDRSENWKTDLDETWDGVRVVGGNVTRLVLNSNKMSGTIPANVFSALPHLEELLLPYNDLTGSIPPDIGDLVELTKLDFEENKFSGSIPERIGDMVKLEELELQENRLTGSIPGSIGDLTELTSMDLSGNRLTGSPPTELRSLSKLTKLFLDGNRLDGTIPDNVFGGLPVLRQLKLDKNKLTGSIPADIGNLPKVRMLDLSSNELSGSIPGELGNLPEVRTLDLSKNELTGSIPGELGNLPEVRTLDLSSNELSGSIPGELGNLPKVETLDLSSNELSGSIPGELGDLTELTSLDISINGLSGEIPEEFRGLGNLASLQAFDNDLGGTIPAGLAELKLGLLVVRGNKKLGGAIPTEFADSNRNLELHAQHTGVTLPDDPDFLEWASHRRRSITVGTRSASTFLVLASENSFPVGLWSDGTTIWVSDLNARRVFAYTLQTGVRDRDKEIVLSDANSLPLGLWSDGTTMWVGQNDRSDQTLYAYRLTDGAPDVDKTIDLTGYGVAVDSWSDGEWWWMLLNTAFDPIKVFFAYTGVRLDQDSTDDNDVDDDCPMNPCPVDIRQVPANDARFSLVSDGPTFWVTDVFDQRLYAYSQEDGAHLPFDYQVLDALNIVPRGAWLDKGALWVADGVRGVLFGYVPSVSFAAESYDATEGGAAATVTLELTREAGSELVVPIVATPQGGAVTADYSVEPPSVTFSATDTSKSFTVTATDDTDDDDGESVQLSFGSLPWRVVTGATQPTATVNLLDNDETLAVTVAFRAATYTATEGGSAATVTLALSAAPEREVTVPIVATLKGGAMVDDYSGVPPSVTFASDQTSKTFTVTATDDTDDDDGESVRLSFGTLPWRVTAGAQSTATVNLVDDDTTLEVTVEAVTEEVTEGEPVRYRIEMSHETMGALVESEYQQSGDFVRNAPSSVVRSIRSRGGARFWEVVHDTVDDGVIEGDGSFTVTIRKPPHELLARGQDYSVGTPSTATVRVLDNDGGAPPAAPPRPAVSVVSGSMLDVKWGAADENEAPLTGYELEYRQDTSGPWSRWPETVAPNTRAVRLTRLSPGTEYEVQVRAENVRGTGPWSEAGSAATAPDPGVTVSISARSGQVNVEGAALAFTVHAAPEPASALRVDVRVTETLAMLSGRLPTSVTVPAGRSSVTFEVATRSDLEDEGDSEVTAELLPSVRYDLGAARASYTVRDDEPDTGRGKVLRPRVEVILDPRVSPEIQARLERPLRALRLSWDPPSDVATAHIRGWLVEWAKVADCSEPPPEAWHTKGREPVTDTESLFRITHGAAYARVSALLVGANPGPWSNPACGSVAGSG